MTAVLVGTAVSVNVYCMYVVKYFFPTVQFVPNSSDSRYCSRSFFYITAVLVGIAVFCQCQLYVCGQVLLYYCVRFVPSLSDENVF
jgi:hypothetical protein